mmetsp:Transcript_38513/g.58613  ORF Transcript_38513/g.58613 Transcript_38513/m.58613 type:complete len:292 (+) Transcript_38513:1754-2629(+)
MTSSWRGQSDVFVCFCVVSLLLVFSQVSVLLQTVDGLDVHGDSSAVPEVEISLDERNAVDFDDLPLVGNELVTPEVGHEDKGCIISLLFFGQLLSIFLVCNLNSSEQVDVILFLSVVLLLGPLVGYHAYLEPLAWPVSGVVLELLPMVSSVFPLAVGSHSDWEVGNLVPPEVVAGSSTFVAESSVDIHVLPSEFFAVIHDFFSVGELNVAARLSVPSSRRLQTRILISVVVDLHETPSVALDVVAPDVVKDLFRAGLERLWAPLHVDFVFFVIGFAFVEEEYFCVVDIACP